MKVILVLLVVVGPMFAAGTASVYNAQVAINGTTNSSIGYSIGYSTSISGNLLALGSFPKTTTSFTSVQVYSCTSPNSCSLVQQLDGETIDDRFGFSVSLSQGLLAVGAPRYPNITTGAFYVYYCTTIACTNIEKKIAVDTDSLLGSSVAVSPISTDSWLVVAGAPGSGFGGGFATMTCSSTSCTSLSYTQVSSQFGDNLYTFGSMLLIASSAESYAEGSNQVYLYDLTNTSSPKMVGYLNVASAGDTFGIQDYFGTSMSASVSMPGIIAIGAPHQGQFRGAVYVFHCSSATSCNTNSSTKIPGNENQVNYLGTGVAVFGYSVAAATDNNQIIIYDCSTVGICLAVTTITTSATPALSYSPIELGYSMSFNEAGTILVAADSGANSDAGVVVLYSCSSSTFPYCGSYVSPTLPTGSSSGSPTQPPGSSGNPATQPPGTSGTPTAAPGKGLGNSLKASVGAVIIAVLVAMSAQF